MRSFLRTRTLALYLHWISQNVHVSHRISVRQGSGAFDHPASVVQGPERLAMSGGFRPSGIFTGKPSVLP